MGALRLLFAYAKRGGMKIELFAWMGFGGLIFGGSLDAPK
jgi:hypothetical protein